MLSRSTIRLGLIVCFVLTMWSPTAEAIPAFARAYKVPCTTCHTTIPRRNEFGDAFRKSGYRWPGDPAQDVKAREQTPVEMKGIGAMLGQLPAQIPLALTMSSSLAMNRINREFSDTAVGSPAFTFLFGSALGEHSTVFGTWAGQGAPNELYVQFGGFAGRKEINLRVGQFEPTTTMFKNNEAVIGAFVLGSSALNGHSMGQSRTGFEGNGLVGRNTYWAAGMVKNAGSNSRFDYYYHISRRVGGMGLDGSEPDVDFDAEPTVWEDVTFTVGHWGYLGHVGGPSGEELADILRFGIDAKVRFRDASVWGGLMLGSDTDVVRDLPSSSLTGFVEANYLLKSWITPTYLFQFQDSEAFVDPKQEHSIGVIALLQENIRVSTALTWNKQTVSSQEAVIQLLMGF